MTTEIQIVHCTVKDTESLQSFLVSTISKMEMISEALDPPAEETIQWGVKYMVADIGKSLDSLLVGLDRFNLIPKAKAGADSND